MKIGVLLFSTLSLLPIAFAQSKTEPPVPVRTVPPDYPPDLRRDHISGVVVVTIEVDSQGNVSTAEIEKSSNAGFNHAAVEALKKWRFKPAQQNGAAVTAKVKIPVKFNNDES